MSKPQSGAFAHLDRLLGYLESDPLNDMLLGDVVNAALRAHLPAKALEIIDTYNQHSPLNDQILNLLGVASLQALDYSRALEAFSQLHKTYQNDKELKFNLAFTLSRLEKHSEALKLLDELTTHALPQAAVLKVQLLHYQGRFDEAMKEVKALLAHHPLDPHLLGVASVLAMDTEDVLFAQGCAQKSLDLYQSQGESSTVSSDALTTIGYFSLDEGNKVLALKMFDEALSARPSAARAWVGKGLAQLSAGDYQTAALNLTKGAQLFKSHLGSWIAAGWAHVLDKDLSSARHVFQHALNLDATFSESYGSLSVVELMEGNILEARSLASKAIRLDRTSFSGALATSLLLAQSGKPDSSAEIFERALTTPINNKGQTLLDAMARSGIKH